MNKNNFRKKDGFTIIEIIFSVLILSFILGLVGAFQADVFNLNRVVQVGLMNQQEAKKIVRPFSNEIRGATDSALGGYPLEKTTSSEIVFFTDLDDDGLAEKVKYYVEDGNLTKSIIEPDPVTYQYDENNEKIIRVIHDVIDNNIFYYFDSNYDGTASTTPLSEPVTPSEVRMIKIELGIDSDPNKPPATFWVTTQVSLRNLKDNL